ncbi:MAG: hypothetical protein QXS27_03770 [Candidatus Jordarchaeaceae archaeon]
MARIDNLMQEVPVLAEDVIAYVLLLRELKRTVIEVMKCKRDYICVPHTDRLLRNLLYIDDFEEELIAKYEPKKENCPTSGRERQENFQKRRKRRNKRFRG